MKLATLRTTAGTTAALIEEDDAILLSYSDAGAALQAAPFAKLGQATTGESIPLAEAQFAPVVPRPSKIICVGLNYADHIAEMGNAPPSAPTCFAKFADALVGATDRIHLPDPMISAMVDWEVELAVVIGASVRHASVSEARRAIAGYTVLNDISMRDWQKRTSQFLLGKTWEHATPVGPWITGADELGDGSGLAVRCSVNGITKQQSNTSELVFGAVDLVSEISKVITLTPGDIIATGTPGGVGFGRDPQEFLADGNILETEIDGIGKLTNHCLQV
ncbi:MAG: fumarylacetoacetate hydrolase family protein [Acidimicrobiales bacterium]|nr:fumarylacetoacetate hydrolase family protein [Acidimicrobiales bacterium]